MHDWLWQEQLPAGRASSRVLPAVTKPGKVRQSMHKNAQKLADDPRRLIAVRSAGMHKNAQGCTTEEPPVQNQRRN
jgi:hypothetical protein